MNIISRIACPHCGAECMEQELNCYQCGKPLKAPLPAPPKEEIAPPDPPSPPSTPAPRIKLFQRKNKEPEKKPVSLEDVLKIDDLYASPKEGPAAEPAESEPTAPTGKKSLITLTGEVVEVEDAESSHPAATIGDAEVESEPEEPVFIISFCRNCGFQNEEGVKECKRCGLKLEVVHEPPPEIEKLPRTWGFDVLGAAWIVLGFAAMYSGIFLIKADHRLGTTLSDYFWTLIVVAVPGVLIFMRHVFCKILFWVMSFASLLIWLVIGFVWLYLGLRLNANSEIGLTWFAVFSALSFVSWFTVRVNDEFDYSL